MFTTLLILQVLLGLAIIVLVLLQQGKGADMGAAFGAGSSGAVFGAGGGGSFFTRATAVLAALFFINSVLLSSPLVRDVQNADTSVTERVEVEKPAVPSDLPDTDIPAPADAAMDLPPADDMPEVPVEPSVPATDTPKQ
ncbi:protein translocase subunit secG [Thiogranum longum]|uniref:Protein-export membrane protein SecG n=1 Tax=Thiogranum longum TaxID=1537524 RepID=A0A4R1HH30_9GAMM|nr:preprotein translocase subunit SecG [Thiogranum longum]TCK18669.1 protein translocase subunit secG [Thiogranum longum]